MAERPRPSQGDHPRFILPKDKYSKAWKRSQTVRCTGLRDSDPLRESDHTADQSPRHQRDGQIPATAGGGWGAPRGLGVSLYGSLMVNVAVESSK